MLTVPGLQLQQDKDLVLQLTKYAIIAAAVAPDVVQLALELLAQLAGVMGADDAFVEISENLCGCLFIQLLELLLLL